MRVWGLWEILKDFEQLQSEMKTCRECLTISSGFFLNLFFVVADAVCCYCCLLYTVFFFVKGCSICIYNSMHDHA